MATTTVLTFSQRYALLMSQALREQVTIACYILASDVLAHDPAVSPEQQQLAQNVLSGAYVTQVQNYIVSKSILPVTVQAAPNAPTADDNDVLAAVRTALPVVTKLVPVS